jgi:hypothetical protein
MSEKKSENRHLVARQNRWLEQARDRTGCSKRTSSREPEAASKSELRFMQKSLVPNLENQVRKKENKKQQRSNQETKTEVRLLEIKRAVGNRSWMKSTHEASVALSCRTDKQTEINRRPRSDNEKRVRGNPSLATKSKHGPKHETSTEPKTQGKSTRTKSQIKKPHGEHVLLLGQPAKRSAQSQESLRSGT